LEKAKYNMKPTKKAQGITDFLNNILGDNRETAISLGFCIKPPIGCGKPAIEFRNEISKKEFAISGLCQQCQDKVFGYD